MKREVWVECDMETANRLLVPNNFGTTFYIHKQTLHESRWIPVSEKPEREGRYPVVFDESYEKSGGEFTGASSYWDGNNWCGYVKLWLEAPLLPVEDEFEKEWDYYQCREPILRSDGTAKKACKWFWNKAKESTSSPATE